MFIKKLLRKLDIEDLGQIIIGSTMLSVPIAFTEEAWRISETIRIPNLFLIFFLSICFIGIYSYQGIYQGSVPRRKTAYLARIMVNYFVTCIVVSVVLLSLDKLPLFQEIIVSLKRIIIVAFPASMGGVVIDSLDKE